MSRPPVLLYNRQTQSVEEEIIFEQGFMDFFYGTPLGLFLTEALLKKKWFSILYGHLKRTSHSRKTIAEFVRRHRINVEEIEGTLEDFENFNQFFIRKLKPSARPIHPDPRALISPADARLLVYPIQTNQVVPVKGKVFALKDLLQTEALAVDYTDGICCIFRLAPADYHRFCYIDEGEQSPVQPIPGFLHSVHPLSLRNLLPVFTENYREYCVLSTGHFGEVLQMDVGALVVGKIRQCQPHGGRMRKGGEKGYFEFGGSTIMLLFQKGRVLMDEDILGYSQQGIETLVRYGERIGLASGADDVGLK